LGKRLLFGWWKKKRGKERPPMKEAMLYEELEENEVQCNLCNHRCKIPEGKRGICAVRENREGTLYSLVYDRLISASVDPIEKKPLFHFLPGTGCMSYATVGCNFRCLHCQNYSISQLPRDHGGRIPGDPLSPDQAARLAEKQGCATIAYTYTEPTVYFEFAYETAVIATERGIKNLFVTNGFMTPEALETIRPYLHGANVDLKSFSDEHYRKVCGGRLQPVLDNIKLMREMGIWVEVTTLLIPTKNDSEEELRSLAEWLVGVGPEIPWHISAFYPTYKMNDLPRTPPSTIHRAHEIGKKAGLRYVYSGNVWGDEFESTFCWSCGARVIDRVGYSIRDVRLRDGVCPDCGATIDGVGLK
jgi:pyruvate formate lyase activating enzyme